MASLSDYDERVRQQIAQYEFVENMHELPPIFHYFSNKVLRPILNEVMEADSMVEFFGKHLMAGFQMNFDAGISQDPEFVSLGSGDGWLEIQIATYLKINFERPFRLTCLEVSPIQVARANAAISSAGLADRVFAVETDINRWAPDHHYDGIMAHHSLHHFVELEHIFAAAKSAMNGAANFVIADMIGRNGHMRWPETLEIIELLWKHLSPEKRRNHQMRNAPDLFDNWDCSGEGFEGIRAQDILPLLMGMFSFRRVIGVGGISDIFVDRAYGWNYDPHDPADLEFIDFVLETERRLTKLGHIKPTQMLAVIGRDLAGDPRVFDGLTVGKMVRQPS